MLALSILSSFRGLRENTAFPRQNRPFFVFTLFCKKKTVFNFKAKNGRFAPADAAEYERPRRVIRRRRVSGAIAPLQGASDCLRFRRAALAALACPQKHFFTSFDFAVFFAFFALEKLRARGNPVRGNAFGEAAHRSLDGVPKRKFPLKRFTEATGKSLPKPRRDGFEVSVRGSQRQAGRLPSFKIS